MPATRQHAFVTALIKRIGVGANRIDIHFRPTRLSTLLDIAATPSQNATDDETQILSVPIKLRRAGREITMLIDGADPFVTAKPDARLIKLLIRARRFNATLVDSDGVPFMREAMRAADLPNDCTLHGLRYTFATRAIELGLDWQTIESIVGHKTAAMAFKYTQQRRQARLAIATLNQVRNANTAARTPADWSENPSDGEPAK